MTTGAIGVYGATGWIGREVSQRAAREGPVRYFARSAAPDMVRVPDRPESERLAEQLVDLRAVIVTAGAAHVPGPESSAEIFANAVLPATIVHAARLAGVARVVLLSSIKAVAEHSEDGPISVTTPPAPATAYGRSKREGELAAVAAADAGLELCIVRTPLVVGADAPANFGRILRFIRRGLPVPLPSPFPQRSVTVRSNLADLLVHLAQSETSPRTYVTTAAMPPLTTAELIRGVAAILHSRSVVVPIPGKLAAGALRAIGRAEDLTALSHSMVVEPSPQHHVAGWAPPGSPLACLATELTRPREQG